MSLSSPHPLISTCGSNIYEINKSIVQLKMLSGRYRTDKLLSYFMSSDSPTCQLSCDSPASVGDLPHLLVSCSSLAYRREVLFEYWDNLAQQNPVISCVISTIKIAPDDTVVQFLLDCTAIPEVSALAETYGNQILSIFFKMTRTFCYSIHRERLKLLNRWSF